MAPDSRENLEQELEQESVLVAWNRVVDRNGGAMLLVVLAAQQSNNVRYITNRLSSTYICDK